MFAAIFETVAPVQVAETQTSPANEGGRPSLAPYCIIA
nr:TPA_inf: a3.1 [Pseudozyma tsukubaensis]